MTDKRIAWTVSVREAGSLLETEYPEPRRITVVGEVPEPVGSIFDVSPMVEDSGSVEILARTLPLSNNFNNGVDSQVVTLENLADSGDTFDQLIGTPVYTDDTPSGSGLSVRETVHRSTSHPGYGRLVWNGMVEEFEWGDGAHASFHFKFNLLLADMENADLEEFFVVDAGTAAGPGHFGLGLFLEDILVPPQETTFVLMQVTDANTQMSIPYDEWMLIDFDFEFSSEPAASPAAGDGTITVRIYPPLSDPEVDAPAIVGTFPTNLTTIDEVSFLNGGGMYPNEENPDPEDRYRWFDDIHLHSERLSYPEIDPVGSIEDEAPSVSDAAEVMAEASVAISDSLSLPSDDVGVDVDGVSGSAQDIAPLAVDQADIRITSVGAVDDLAPLTQDTASIDRGPTLGQLAEELPLPSDAISVEADSAGFDINDVAPLATDEAGISIGAVASFLDAPPLVLDSVDASVGAAGSVSDSTPAPIDEAELSIVAQGAVSDAAPIPTDSVAVERGPTVADISDELSPPSDSIAIHADSASFDVGDVAPLSVDGASISLEVATSLSDGAPAAIDSVDASIVAQGVVSDVIPSPIDAIFVERGPTVADISDEAAIPEDSATVDVDSAGFNINDVGPLAVDEASASVEMFAHLSDGPPLPVDSIDVAFGLSGSWSDLALLPEDSAEIDVATTASIDDAVALPIDASEAAVAVAVFGMDEPSLPSDALAIEASVDAEITDAAILPQDAVSADIETAGFVLNDVAPAAFDSVDAGVLARAEVDDQPPPPLDEAQVALGITATALDELPIPSDSVSTGVSISSTLVDLGPMPLDAATVSAQALGDLADLVPTPSDAIEVLVADEVQAVLDDLLPLPDDAISLTSLSLTRTLGLFDEFELPARFDDLEGRFAPYLEEARSERFDGHDRPRRFPQDDRPLRPFPQSVQYRAFPTTTRVARHLRTDQVRRFMSTVVAREEEPMELEMVEFGPYTVNEIPEPLYVRVHETLRDGSTKPMELHGQQPEWTARVSIKPPEGQVQTRSAEVVDPSTLQTAEPDNFDSAEPGWVRVDWVEEDFSDPGVYEVQLTLDNGTLRLKSTAVYQPHVVVGPAADVVAAS